MQNKFLQKSEQIWLMPYEKRKRQLRNWKFNTPGYILLKFTCLKTTREIFFQNLFFG